MLRSSVMDFLEMSSCASCWLTFIPWKKNSYS